MSQHLEAINEVTHYTRVDFTALRAYLCKLDSDTILRLYYHEDDLEDRHIEGPAALGRFLEHMRDDLISRLIDSNPHVAEALQRARQSSIWSKTAIDYLVGAADAAVTTPRPKDPVTLWFRPVAAKRLKADGIETLEHLMKAIRARGRGWYRPIACLGKGKADTIVRWLRRYEGTLGSLPHALSDIEDELRSDFVVVDRFTTALVPFERMRLAKTLDGSQGENRHHIFPLITARNDYDAVQAYLYKYRGQDKTHRSYQKEIERFLLWCISERGKALSSMLVDDCEAYKDFLAAPPERWQGVRRPRKSPDWRPFAGTPAPESQRYAVQALRAFFNYLVGVRYVAANPWIAVKDPAVDQQINTMQIEKALPADLWNKLADEDGILDQLCALPEAEVRSRYHLKGFGARQPVSSQLRLFRAIVLLLGNTGLRREEVAFAYRRNLQPYPQEPGIWRLAVLGKRSKWRFVYPSDREINAIRAHWADRGDDFSFGMSDIPLLSPVIIPPTGLSLTKHGDGSGHTSGKGFSPDGIYTSVTSWLKRIADDDLLDLSIEERNTLRTAGIHAFRHTFGTQAVADDMPLDVVQKILGHSTLNTTTIYVQSETKRAASEVGKWMAKKRGKGPI